MDAPAPAWPPAARRLAAGLVLLGIVVRLRDFLLVRSLWLDEVMLARNLVERPAGGLLRPLDHDQAAPVGFLLLQKAVVHLCGQADWSFRLVPLVFGIWALVLFAGLMRRFVGPVAGLVGVALFAGTASLTGATAKQYPVDLWAALAAVTLIARAARSERPAGTALWLSLAGAALVWLSHAVPLVLAAAGGMLIVGRLLARRWADAAWLAAAAGVWLASFATAYVAITRHLHASLYLAMYWRNGFPPREAGLADGLAWIGHALNEAMRSPAGFKWRWLGLTLIALGMWRLRRSPGRLGLTAVPIAIALVVAVARLAPFQGRLVLYLVPAFFALTVAGIDGLLRSGRPVIRAAGVAVALAVVWQPILDARAVLLRPLRWEEPREVMAFVAEQCRPGDIVYVHPNAVHTVAFYGRRHALDGVAFVPPLIAEAAVAEAQVRDLPAASRVWAFHMDVRNGAVFCEPLSRAQLCDALAAQRDCLAQRAAPGVTAFLYSAARSAPVTATH